MQVCLKEAALGGGSEIPVSYEGRGAIRTLHHGVRLSASLGEEAVLEEFDDEEGGGQAACERDRARAVPGLPGAGAADEDEGDEEEYLPGEAEQVRVREDVLPLLVVLALDYLERDEEQHDERHDPVPSRGPFEARKVEQRRRCNRPDKNEQQEQYPDEPQKGPALLPGIYLIDDQ